MKREKQDYDPAYVKYILTEKYNPKPNKVFNVFYFTMIIVIVVAAFLYGCR